MRIFRDIIVLAACYSLLLVGSIFLQLWITIPLGIVITVVLILRKRSQHRVKIEEMQRRLSNLRSEGLLIEGKAKGTEDDVFYHMILTLLTDLERSLFKLVEKNIQLLSLKEIGRSIISSLEEKNLVDSVFDYLVRGVGYKETAIIFLRKKKMCFQALITIEKPTKVIRRVLNFGFKDITGALSRSFISGRPFLIKDVNMHPLTTVAGEPLFPGSTMTSYLCVPLMKSVNEIQCFESDNCPIKQMMDNENHGPLVNYLSHEVCLSCSDIPLLGALIVTDGYRATPLTDIDQVTLETVGSLVSSIIENWYLYQELSQEKTFREKVIEGMINGIFAIDLDGNVTLANTSVREMSQLPLQEITKLNINDLIVGETTRHERERPFLSILQDRMPLTYHEAFLKRKDGIHIPIRLNASPLVGEDKEIQGAIIEFVDLSEMKRMEEEIRHLDRLAVLGRFTSAVAHEIRNPLTGIAAGIQYLNRGEHLSIDQRENISFILNEVERLNRIITDLFKVAKPQRLQYQKVDIPSLVNRGFQSVSGIFENKRIDFDIDFDDNLPIIEVDPDQIVQVMINLIKNSAEAVEEGGKVWIKSKTYEGGDVEVVREKDKNLVCIEIFDNGWGIDPKDQEKIFEPFFSRKKGGTGLGLFVTHSIIQQHQGRITVLSQPGDGTTFRVYLPINRPKKGGVVEASHSSR